MPDTLSSIDLFFRTQVKMVLRLPKKLINMYHFEDDLVLEVREEGVLIKAPEQGGQYSWEETYADMAAEAEDWDDFDFLAEDSAEISRYSVYQTGFMRVERSGASM